MERHRPIQTQGLYDPTQEHDACGFGFVVDTKGRPSHDIVQKALKVLHRPCLRYHPFHLYLLFHPCHQLDR